MDNDTNKEETNIFGSTDQELEAINVDGEHAKAAFGGQQTLTGEPTTTTMPFLIQDHDDLEKYVVKNINRQDISSDMLATLDEHYYDNVQKYVTTTGKVNRYLWQNIDDFVNTRIAIILTMSETFSTSVFSKLSHEEKDLYSKVCELVDCHRKEVYSKIKKK